MKPSEWIAKKTKQLLDGKEVTPGLLRDFELAAIYEYLDKYCPEVLDWEINDDGSVTIEKVCFDAWKYSDCFKILLREKEEGAWSELDNKYRTEFLNYMAIRLPEVPDNQ